MGNRFKRLISVALCAAMLATSLAMPIHADEKESYGVSTVASYSAPVVEITGAKVYDKMYVCEVPTIKVTSDAGLQKVRVYGRSYGTKEDNYKVTEIDYDVKESFEDLHSYSYTVDSENQGAIFIEATDVQGKKTTSTIFYGHLLGMRSSVIVPPTCHDKGYTEMTYYCKYCSRPYYSYRYSETATKEHTYPDQIDKTVSSPCGMDGVNVTLNQRMCTVCGEVKTDVINGQADDYSEDEHEWTSDGAPAAKEATCDEYGCSYQVCKTCGAIRVDPDSDRQRPAGHKPGDEYVLTKGSCTQAEVRAKDCTVCGETVSKTTVGTAPGHKYDISGVEIDCVTGYQGEVECEVCHEMVPVNIPPAEHKYELRVITEPTCTEPGKKANVCTVCGKVSEEITQVIDPKGHTPAPDDNDCSTPVLCTVCEEIVTPAQEHEFPTTFESKYSDSNCHWNYCVHDGCNAVNKEDHYGKRPSCTEPYRCEACGTMVYTPGTHKYVAIKKDNLYHSLKCEICGFTHPGQRIHNMTDDGDCLTAVECECGHIYREAKTEHTYSSTPVKDNENTHTYTCINSGCQVTKTEAHQYTVTEEILEPVTCYANGRKKIIKTCVCGDVIETEEEIVSTGHSFGEWETKESTCTSAGTKTRRCTVCGYDEIEELGPAEHTWGTEYIVDQEATCTSEGTESIHCTVCGAVKPDGQKTIPMKAHTSGEYKIISEPTCTVPGRKIMECSICKAEMGEEEEIPANGHTYGEAEHIGQATCTEPGLVQYTCQVCGDIKGPEECPDHKATGHLFVWRNNGDAAIGKNETRTPVCSVCGYEDTEHTEEIPDTALHEHSYIEWTYNNDATCFEDGTQWSICAICQDPETKTVKTAEGTKLSHVFTDYQPNGDATCQKNGTETATCANGCGTTDTREDDGSQLAHKFENYIYNNDATCEKDGTEAAVCEYGCSETDVREKAGTKLSHSFTVYVSDNNVTCDSMGTETAECDNGCGEKHTRNAGGTPSHIWCAPEFKWADDSLTAEVVFTCERDKTHIRTVPADVTWTTEPATCEETGKTVYGFEVEIDGVEYADKREVEIPALGHSYGEPSFTWSEDFKTAEALFTCHNDETHTVKKAATVTSEEIDSGSCEQGAIHKYTATVEFDGKTYTGTQTDSLPAAGHDFGEPVFTFSDDGKTAAAKVVCKNDGNHFIDLDVAVTSKVKTEADCENDGVTVYTATAEFDGKTYTFEKEVTDIPAKGHSYGAPKITWSDDGKKATALFTCANDSAHTETVEGTMTSAVTSEAQCEIPGVTTYTAEFVFGGMSYVEDNAVSDIPAKGHDYEKGVCTVCGAKEEHDHASEVYVTDKSSHWKNCDKCGEMFAFGTHEFAGDICTVCGYEREHVHSYGDDYKTDETNHWKVCETCGEAGDKEAHNFDGDVCTVCGYERDHVHSYGDDYKTDENNHWKVCETCGEATDKEAHKFDGDVCTVCGYEREHVHSYGDDYKTDETNHWKVCETCGEPTEKEAHNFDGDVCTVCGYEREHVHSYGDDYKTDETNHWKVCETCGEAGDKEAHNFDGDVCTVCGYERDHVHSYGDDYKTDENNHWKVCETCGEATDKEAHKFVGNKCSVCGYTKSGGTGTPSRIPERYRPGASTPAKELIVEPVEVSEDIHSEVVGIVSAAGMVHGVYFISLGTTDYKPGQPVRVRVYAPGATGDSVVLIRDEWELLKDANMTVDGDYVEFTVDAGLIDAYHYFAVVTGFDGYVEIGVPQQAKISHETENTVK